MRLAVLVERRQYQRGVGGFAQVRVEGLDLGRGQGPVEDREFVGKSIEISDAGPACRADRKRCALGT